MPSIIEQAQQAGFSQEEVGQWAAGVRSQAKAAGFGDEEISAYLGGTVTPPKVTPQPFLSRLLSGVKNFGAGALEGLTLPGEELATRVPGMTGAEVAGATVGREPLGSIIDLVRQGGQALEKAYTTGEQPKPEEALNYAMLALPNTAGHFSVPKVDAAGVVRSVPIGKLPKGEDFASAAVQTVGSSPMSVQEKLLRLYTEEGVHPAEAALDAASDPTVTQALASHGTDLPDRYQNEVPAKMPEPPAEAKSSPAPAVEVPPPPIPGAIPNGIQSFRPGDLLVDPERFQFKAGTDEQGLSDRLQGVENWDPIKGGLSLVWQDAEGKNFVVDGHQRYGLAQRIAAEDPEQDPKLNALVVREGDGISDVEARVMAASKNMAEGTGTAIDAAKVLRDRPDLVNELPPRSELVRQARGLANLADEPFGAVVNEVVPPNYGAIVGRFAPDDPKLQGALIDLLAKTEPQNATQAEAIVRQGMAAGTRTETQASLFGDQEVVSSLYADRARVLDRSLRDLKRDRQVFSTLVRDRDIVQAVGNRLEATANAQRLAADSQAVQILQILANRRGALSDALTAAARRAADGDSAGAIRDFVAAVRGQAESGDLVRAADGLDRGRVDVAGKDAASTVDPTAGSLGPAAEQRAAADAADIIGETARAEPQIEQTEQGAQLVVPGAERSARQAAEAREAAGHGMIRPSTSQAAPGGMFASREEPEAELQFGPETGAIAWGPRPKPAPGSLEEAQQSILDKLSVGQGSPRRPLTLSRIYTAVFDKLYPISEAREGPQMAHLDPYKLTRNLAGEAGKIDHFLTHGTIDYATREINGPSLEAVLNPVKDDLDNFRVFATAARGLELEARGITTGMDLGAMRRVAREGIAKYEPTLTALVGYQNRVAAYLRDSGVLSREGYDAMTQANQLYVPFQRVMEPNYQGAAGAGGSMQARNPIARILGSERDIIDPIESVIRNTASMVTMADKNEAGNALINMLTRQGDIGVGERKPIAAVELEPDPELDAALHEFLNRHGVQDHGELLDMLHAAASPPIEAGQVAVFRDGIRHAYEVDPELAAAWKGLDGSTAGAMERLLRPFASMLRAGAVLTPDFALRHSVRDFLYATVTSAHGMFSPADMARGFIGQITKNDAYWRWVQGGGSNISMVSIDRRFLQEDIARLTEQTGLMTRAQNVVADPNASWLQKGGAIAGLPFRAAGKYVIHPLQVLTTLAENATHLGAFIKEERRLGTAGVTGKEAIQEAAFASRDIAVDAARIGAKMRAYNMITAFANITLQDGDRVVRAFVNNPVATSLKIGGAISLPSAVLWWVNHDDPRYKELPQWEKDLFWVIPTDKWEDVGPAGQYGPPNPGTPYRVQGDRLQVNNGAIFRVPKPWGMGVLFGSGVERTLEAFAAHNPEAFKHWGDSIASVSIPSFVPTAVSPILNQWTNRDTFTNRTLVPDQMEKWLPEYQYTPYTTETAKELGKIIGAFPGVRTASISQDSPVAGGVARALSSPILIENYVRGFTGTLGTYALNLADAALRKTGELPDPPLPTKTLADIPVVRAFIARYPTATTQSIQDFEDRYQANKVYYDTWLAKAREGDPVAAARIQSLGGQRMFLNLDGVQKAISEQGKLIRDINKNPQMTPSDKRQLIDTIYYREIELGQAGKAALAHIDATLGPR